MLCLVSIACCAVHALCLPSAHCPMAGISAGCVCVLSSRWLESLALLSIRQQQQQQQQQQRGTRMASPAAPSACTYPSEDPLVHATAGAAGFPSRDCSVSSCGCAGGDTGVPSSCARTLMNQQQQPGPAAALHGDRDQEWLQLTVHLGSRLLAFACDRGWPATARSLLGDLVRRCGASVAQVSMPASSLALVFPGHTMDAGAAWQDALL